MTHSREDVVCSARTARTGRVWLHEIPSRRMPYADVKGLKMYYEVHGDGPPLVLLHGGTGSIPEQWIPIFTARFQGSRQSRWVTDAPLTELPPLSRTVRVWG